MQNIVLVSVLVLIIIQRIKRSIGFQKYNPTTLIIRMVAFGIMTLAILSSSILYPLTLFYDGLGVIAGLVLAYIATNHAEFEKKEDGLYFKTHIWVEIVVIALFLARFVYRVVMVKDMFQSDESQQDIQTRMHSIRDPVTGTILFAFCTYYLGYFTFILREGKKALKA